MKLHKTHAQKAVQKNAIGRKLLTMLIIFCMVFSMITPVLASETADSTESGTTGEADIFGFSGQTGTEKTESESAEESDTSAAAVKTQQYSAADYTVTVQYPAEALPENAQLQVREIRDNMWALWEKAEYDSYMNQARETAREENRAVSAARFFDISFVAEGSDAAAAQQVEPTAPVDVHIEFENTEEVSADAEMQVVHLPEGAANTIVDSVANAPAPVVEDTAAAEGNAAESVSFTADSFSVYGVLYTVDFWYGEYEYHLNGEGEIMVSELLKELGLLVTEETENTDSGNTTQRIASMADVLDVTFSDESLVKVEKVGEDWKLTSLKAFDTEEKLTIETKDGVIEIRVTDASTFGYKFKVVRDRNQEDLVGTYDTLEEAADAINNYTNAVRLYIGDIDSDYAVNNPIIFTATRNNAITIYGNGNTITRGASVTGDVITNLRTAALTINDLTIDGGTASTGALVKKTVNGAVTFSNVTFKGSCENFYYSSAGNGDITFTNTTLDGTSVSGHLINQSGTGKLTITGGSITGSASGSGSLICRAASNNMGDTALSGVALNGGNTSGDLIYLKGNTDTRQCTLTLTSCTINSQQSTGSILKKVGANPTTITGGTITGPTVNSSANLIDIVSAGALTIGGASAPVTIYRGNTTGSAVSNTGTGSLTITNSAISGAKSATDSTSVSATSPLIQQGTGALTLSGATVENHIASNDSCAVDASRVTGTVNVKVSGNTSITGNTNASGSANLSVTGTNILQIPTGSTLLGTVGVTTPNNKANNQFASLGSGTTSLGFENFTNDADSKLSAAHNGTAVFWLKSKTDANFYITGARTGTGNNTYYYKTLNEAIADTAYFTSPITIYGMTEESTMTAAATVPSGKVITIQPGNDKDGNALTNITVKRGDINGNMITTSNNITIKNVTFSNPLEYTVDGGFLKVPSGAATVTMENVTYNAGRARGCFVEMGKGTTGVVSISGSTVNGPTVASEDSIIMNQSTGAMTISNSTVTRGQDYGTAIRQANGDLNITDSTIDGNGDNVTVNGNLVYVGKGALTINDSTIQNHKADRDGAYAVDCLAMGVVVTQTKAVNIGGSTKIIGNTAAGKAANLAVTKDSRLNITSTLTNDVGISNVDNYMPGLKFGVLANRNYSSSASHLKNDFKPSLDAEVKNNTDLYWEDEVEANTPVVKVTDTAGNILYRSANTKALFKLSELSGRFDRSPNMFYFINSELLYTDASCTHKYTGEPYVQLLRDIHLNTGSNGGEGDGGIDNNNSLKHDMTLMTASKTDAEYPFVGSSDVGTMLFVNGSYTSHTTADGATDNRFGLDGGCTVTVKNLIIDGNGRIANDGALFKLKSGTASKYNTLILDEGAVLQNGRTNLSDPAGCILLNSYARLYMKPGSLIQNCASNDDGQGGAIYVGNHAEFHCSGGEIRGCVSSKGGAIESGTSAAGGVPAGSGFIYLSGSPKIIENYGNLGERRNIYLSDDNNTVVYADGSSGLEEDAEIGIYVTDNLMNKHGREGMPFGTILDGHNDNLDAFSNDRDPHLYGDQGLGAGNTSLIVWYYRLEVEGLEDYYIDSELIKTIEVEGSEGVYRPSELPKTYTASEFDGIYRHYKGDYILNKKAAFDHGALVEYIGYDTDQDVTAEVPVITNLRYVSYLQGRKWQYSADNGSTWKDIHGRPLKLHYNRVTRDNLKLDKVEDTNSTEKLTGAKFKLERSYPDTSEYTVYSKGTGQGQDTGANGIYTTDANGSFIMNLPEGYYRLTETEPAEGYTTISDPITFRVKVEAIPDTTENEQVSPYNVETVSTNASYSGNGYAAWNSSKIMGTFTVGDPRKVPLHILVQKGVGEYELNDNLRTTEYVTAPLNADATTINNELNPAPAGYVNYKIYYGSESDGQYTFAKSGDNPVEVTSLTGTENGIIVNGDSSQVITKDQAVYYVIYEEPRTVPYHILLNENGTITDKTAAWATADTATGRTTTEFTVRNTGVNVAEAYPATKTEGTKSYRLSKVVYANAQPTSASGGTELKWLVNKPEAVEARKANNTDTADRIGDLASADEVYFIYNAGYDLTISKTVNGAMGDQTKLFKVDVTSDALTGTSYKDENGTVYNVTNNTVTVSVKHGDSIRLKELPGGNYTVKEQSTGESYKVTYSGVTDMDADAEGVQFELSADATVAITNTLGDIAPTGVSPTSIAFVLILLAGAAIAGGAVITRRKRTRA